MEGKARTKEHKVFYGWWIILVAAVGLFLCYGPVIVYTFGVFLKPLSQEFNWSRAEISLGFSLFGCDDGSISAHRPTGRPLWRAQGDRALGANL